ncbi:MAG: hypothetical protein ABL925_09335 [Methylococcales bacterium]
MNMKNQFMLSSLLKAGVGLFAIGAAIFLPAVHAATISGGALTLDIDRNKLITAVVQNKYPDAPTDNFPICCRPSLYLEEFYDASAANKTFAQLRDENTPDLYDSVSDEIYAKGLQFTVNGPSIAANPAGRNNKPNFFWFDPADLTGSASGQIGLGGVMRFRVDVSPPSNRVLLGDMTLQYDPSLVDTVSGRSGWVLMNNISFSISGFDLFNVTTNLTGNSLTLNGGLGLGPGFAHLGGITDTDVGTFSFQTTVVPVPVALWMFVSGVFALAAAGYRKRRV